MNPDLMKLLAFLTRAEEVLEELVKGFTQRIWDATAKRVQEAWKELASHRRELRTWIETNRSALQKLASVGLTGAQLALKLHGFSEADTAYRNSPFAGDGLRKRVLEWMNRILGSLAAVAPGAEAVKEFKDALEGLLGDARD